MPERYSVVLCEDGRVVDRHDTWHAAIGETDYLRRMGVPARVVDAHAGRFVPMRRELAAA